MKRTVYILLVMLLLGGLFGMAQIKPIKKPKTTPKTEQTAKPKQSSSSSSSKTKKTRKTSSQDLPIRMSQAQKDSIIHQVIDDMVWVEDGTFLMGATSEQGNDAFNTEMPVHKVMLSGYYIGKYEVTQELWMAVMGSNPSYFKGNALRPVEQVSWDECQEFICELNRLTGKSFRLPTEAEWEFAARGGKLSRGYKYSGSNALDNVAWHNDNSGSTTHPVGLKSPNELGLYDMSGNIWEWCQDWNSNYSPGYEINPSGPASGYTRVIRGGSWYGFSWDYRVSNRFYRTPKTNWSTIGLRLAASSL